MSSTAPTIPAHVPSELVFDFDIWNLPGQYENPHDFWMTLRQPGVPRIFYTPRNGGHWMLHRYEDTLEGYRDTEFFTNYPNGIPARRGGAAKLIPVEIDPPEHVKYRNVLGPAFNPPAVKRQQDRIRARMVELIESVLPQGRCDFVRDISGRLPTSVFLNLMGMPMSDFDAIMEMEHAFLRGATPEIQEDGANRILSYVSQHIEQASKAPGDDITGVLLKARDKEGQPWSRDEIVNCAFLLYVAGLDTVTNMLGFIWHRLASRPQEQQYIASHLDEVPKFVEELMRLGSPALNARRVRRDGTWRGVFMKAGDAVLNAPANANRDASQFERPDDVIWDRENARHQIAFGAGPHRCVGQHLARQEIVIALEEWFKRIPSFQRDANQPLKPYVGNIMGFASLALVWEPSRGR